MQSQGWQVKLNKLCSPKPTSEELKESCSWESLMSELCDQLSTYTSAQLKEFQFTQLPAILKAFLTHSASVNSENDVLKRHLRCLFSPLFSRSRLGSYHAMILLIMFILEKVDVLPYHWAHFFLSTFKKTLLANSQWMLHLWNEIQVSFSSDVLCLQTWDLLLVKCLSSLPTKLNAKFKDPWDHLSLLWNERLAEKKDKV